MGNQLRPQAVFPTAVLARRTQPHLPAFPKNNMLPKVIGTNNIIHLTNGQPRRVVLLNNAATTPPFEYTLKKVNQFLQTYGAMHRGAGPHANITCNRVDKAIKTIRAFVGAGEKHSLIFTANTSSVINLFARMLKLTRDDVIITTDTEHTSNNLPWRYNTGAEIVEIKSFSDGSIDYHDLENKVRTYRGRLKLIAITGASNMTGYIPEIGKIAKLAHQYQARIFVDAAQLAPHRPINMVMDNVDALAFSAHKVYAPFGLGVLVLPTKMLDSKPLDPGGGSIDMISNYNYDK